MGGRTVQSWYSHKWRKSFATKHLSLFFPFWIFPFLNVAIFLSAQAGWVEAGELRYPRPETTAVFLPQLRYSYSEEEDIAEVWFICSMCSFHVSLLRLTIKRHIKNRTFLASSRQTGSKKSRRKHILGGERSHWRAQTHTPLPSRLVSLVLMLSVGKKERWWGDVQDQRLPGFFVFFSPFACLFCVLGGLNHDKKSRWCRQLEIPGSILPAWGAAETQRARETTWMSQGGIRAYGASASPAPQPRWTAPPLVALHFLFGLLWEGSFSC